MDTELTKALEDLREHVGEQINERMDEAENRFEARRQKAALESHHGDGGRESEAKRGDLLTKGQKVSSAVRSKRPNDAYDEGDFSLGAVLSALYTGNAENLNDLERKSLQEGVGTSGGYFIPEYISSQVIDLARNKARVIEAGALTIPMYTDIVHLPKITSDPVAVWKVENAALSGSDPGINRVDLNSRTCAVMTLVSRELFEDATPESYGLLTNALTQAVALELDRAALRGSGTGQEPTGLSNTAGVNVRGFGANGGTPTDYDWLIDASSDCWAANADPAAMASIYASRTAATLEKIRTGIASDKTQLKPPAAVDKLNRLISNQIPVNLTVGTSVDCSQAFTGQFSSMAIGVKPSISVRLETSPAPYLNQLSVLMVAWIRADVAILRPAHFTVTSGIRP